MVSDGLAISAALADELLAHARTEVPNEACGILSGSAAEGRATTYHPARNAEASPYVYTVHPDDLVRIVLGIEDAGEDLVAIFHSHTHTPAEPSPTDRRQAMYPDAVYLLATPGRSRCRTDAGAARLAHPRRRSRRSPPPHRALTRSATLRPMPPFPTSVHRDRLTRAAAEAGRRDLDAILVTPSSDYLYLLGYAAPPLERLTCLVVRPGASPTLVLPHLEEPLARHELGPLADEMDLRTWEETDDPFAVVAEVLGDVPAAWRSRTRCGPASCCGCERRSMGPT